ncbi:MAG: hypothetical protein TE42_08865 [Candidatus Synechococcus spongiarum SP3]|uniref:Uncharacterized protein n=1 Tax=Candidatus Synechococcus spongiarum SP3 TaxID=1604020 RepID=A0A0G2HJE2_9SYNE|nr:MAG: hypothetical protein TE42_08865 [Candidatus Synechococcus spongiarum SP3]
MQSPGNPSFHAGGPGPAIVRPRVEQVKADRMVSFANTLVVQFQRRSPNAYEASGGGPHPWRQEKRLDTPSALNVLKGME